MKYREILFGFLFGVGACVIDITMHAQMTGRPFAEELIQPSPEMLFYRALFLLFGAAIGIVLWQRNKREREARRLGELLQKLRQDITAPLIMIHSNAERLLMRDGLAASSDAETLLRSIYEQSKKAQSIARE